MKISSKARYGLKAMCIVAAAYPGHVCLTQIAESSGMSATYLEQLLIKLRKGGLIDAVRGAGGGYYLARDPAEIGVGEVVRVLEDGLKIVDCIHGDCATKAECATYDVWNKVYQAINNTLDDMSLKSLIEKEEK